MKTFLEIFNHRCEQRIVEITMSKEQREKRLKKSEYSGGTCGTPPAAEVPEGEERGERAETTVEEAPAKTPQCKG